MLAWSPNVKLQLTLLKNFIMINEGLQNLKTNEYTAFGSVSLCNGIPATWSNLPLSIYQYLKM